MKALPTASLRYGRFVIPYAFQTQEKEENDYYISRVFYETVFTLLEMSIWRLWPITSRQVGRGNDFIVR